MKYCPKCNKLYEDNFSYCSSCGTKLESMIQYDIFGEPINNNKEPNYQGSATLVNNDKKNKLEKASEMLALLSIGLSMIPLYGILICFVAMVLNIKMYSTEKKHLGYLIISIVTLIFSVVFLFLIIKYGSLSELSEIVEEP